VHAAHGISDDSATDRGQYSAPPVGGGNDGVLTSCDRLTGEGVGDLRWFVHNAIDPRNQDLCTRAAEINREGRAPASASGREDNLHVAGANRVADTHTIPPRIRAARARTIVRP
jgi:hypothetical protein